MVAKAKKARPVLPEILHKTEKVMEEPEETKKIEKSMVEKAKPARKRYERIPIVRFEDFMRTTKAIVYRGFVPRSSDNYFRLMK